MDNSEKKTRPKTVWKAVDVPNIYANVVGVGSTPYDVNIVLGEIDTATPEEITANPRLKLTLSPELAANVHTLLGLILDGYVKGNGPLRTQSLANADEMKRRLAETAIKLEG